MEPLKNREIAIIIWGIILIIIILLKSTKTTNEGFKNVTNAFFKQKIIIPFSLMLLYITLIILILHKMGLWEVRQIKDTIIWSASVASISFFKINDPNFIQNFIKNNLKLVLIVEFILSFYQFNLFIELILVLVSFFIGAMLVISQNNKEQKPLVAFLNWILIILGVILIIHAVIRLIFDFNEFNKVDTIYDLSLSPLMSLLFLPFVMILNLYVKYDSSFARLKILIKDPILCSYAKQKAILSFHVRSGHLLRWNNLLSIIKIDTKEDVRSSITEITETVKREKNRLPVPFEEGWSPYIAKDFLKKEGILTGYYHRCYEEEWFACSNYNECGNELISNNISYYLEGTKTSVKVLKLVLNVNSPQTVDKCLPKYISLAQELYKKSLDAEMPDNIELAIINRENKADIFKGKIATVFINIWPEDLKGGYSIKLSIQ